jgi:hypothetical protein
MAVDTSIQFNSYNSYKFNTGEVLHCYPFGVEGMDYITHSFVAYTPLALASAVRATTTFFDADSEIVSSVDHSFDTPQGTFEQRTITVPVPATAVKAQLTYKNSAADPWWVATPKTEEGQTATPYAVNTYGQMTYITPNGIYTGTLTANQIVLASGDETLGDRLVAINSNQISLESRVDGVEPKVTKITSAGIYTGTIQASQITATSLSAISANLGTVNAGTLNGVYVNTDKNITIGESLNMPVYVPMTIQELLQIAGRGSKGIRFGKEYNSVMPSFITVTDRQYLFHGTTDNLANQSISMTIRANTSIELQSESLTVTGNLNMQEGKILSMFFGGNHYNITRDSNGYLRAL